jgi:hypothetical protein
LGLISGGTSGLISGGAFGVISGGAFGFISGGTWGVISGIGLGSTSGLCSLFLLNDPFSCVKITTSLSIIKPKRKYITIIRIFFLQQ